MLEGITAQPLGRHILRLEGFSHDRLLQRIHSEKCFHRSLQEAMELSYRSEAFDDGSELIQMPCMARERLLDIEVDRSYALLRFGEVGWHVDDHDEDWYTLHILQTDIEPELHLKRNNSEVVRLSEGVSYLFNSNIYHRTTQCKGGNTYAILGGVDKNASKHSLAILGSL